MMTSVIFDMDGLMFDTERVHIMAWDAAGIKMGVGPAGYLSERSLGLNWEASKQVLFNEFGKDFDVDLFKEKMDEACIEYYKTNKVPEKKGLHELLEYLKNKGYRLAVASSSSAKDVNYNLRDAGILEYFDVLLCGDMVEFSKPDPDIYLKTCKALGENPENCYALEDARTGIMSAHAAGCKVIMIPDLWPGDEKTDSLLFAKAESLDKVIEII